MVLEEPRSVSFPRWCWLTFLSIALRSCGSPRFTRSIGDSCMKDVECARFYNERVPDGLAKMLPLPKKPYVPPPPPPSCDVLSPLR